MIVFDFIFAVVCIWCGTVIVRGINLVSSESLSSKDKIISIVLGFVLSFGGWKLLLTLIIDSQ
tara:strand:+ start:580 stop:768 length:189 start_codon:yes stop_codon:yes gene_type:complete